MNGIAGRPLYIAALRATAVGLALLASVCGVHEARAQDVESVRSAFTLGFQYGLAKLVHAKNPSLEGEARAAYDDWMADASSSAEALGLSIETAPGDVGDDPAVQVIVDAKEQIDLMARRIFTLRGAPTAAALTLGFRSTVATQTIPYLNPEARQDAADELRALAVQAGIPRTTVDRYAAALVAGGGGDAAISAAFQFKDDLMRHLETAGPDAGAIARRQLAVWRMGWELGLAALGQTQGADPAMVERMFNGCRAYADALRVSLPMLPEAAEGAGDTARVLHYLLEEAGERVAGDLGNLYGPRAKGLWELATKSTIALILYGPDDEMGLTLADAMERAALRAELPPPTYAGVIAKMRARQPYPTVKAELAAMNDRIVAHYLSALD